jgi:hypothetical protein
MSNLEQALRLNLFEEMELIPTELKEEFIHSENYNRQINRLFDKMRGDKYHRFTKKATTIILVAAILFALVVAGFAATIGRDFLIKTFSDHFEYIITDKSNSKRVKSLQVMYLPEGFVLESESGDSKTISHKYFTHGDKYVSINKSSIKTSVGYDTDYSDSTLVIDGVTYVYISFEDSDINGYIWNKDDYIYFIQGNISSEMLIEIAKQVY